MAKILGGTVVVDEHILISKVKEKFKEKTFKEISALSGLNMTRIFRIFNGHKISYQEAIILHRLIGDKNNKSFNLINENNSKKIEAKIYRLEKLEKIIGLGK